MAPGRDPQRLQDELLGLLEDLWHVPRFTAARRAFRPHVDCFRAGEPPALTVVVELPGVDPDSVQVVAEPRILTITGERHREVPDGAVYHQMEIEYGPFARRIALPEDVDASTARASYRRGVLTIVLPLAHRAPAQPVSISVRRAG